MSFLHQLEGEAPALTLEETLAFLDSFDDSFDDTELSCCTSGTSSTTSSPGHEDNFDDCDVDMDDLLNSTMTVAGGSSGSERSWSDSDDYYSGVSSPNLPSLDEVSSATGGGGGGGSVAKKTTKANPPPPPPQQIHPKQRQKRKAAASTNVSPRAGSKPEAADATSSGAKRRTRKQPKAEILRLRDQVEELQVRLAQLQKAGGGPSDGASGQVVQVSSNSARTEIKQKTDRSSAVAVRSPQPENASMWLDHAVEQYKALQKAETLNVKLKAEVKRQSSLGKSLKALFTKKTAQHRLDFAAELEPGKSSNNALESGKLWEKQNSKGDEDADLYKSIGNMHIEIDNVQRNISPEGDFGSVFSSSKTKQDKVFGPVFELKTNTPVQFADFRHLAHTFCAGALKVSDTVLTYADTGSSKSETHIARNIFEGPVSMTLQSHLGELTVNGVIVMCKVEEVHRSVFTFAATLAVVGNSTLVFREYGWMIVTPYKTETTNSLFQTFYRLHTEKRTGKTKTDTHVDAPSPETPAPASESTATDNDGALQDVVMKMLSDTMRAFQNGVQNSLLTETANIANLEIPSVCPLQKYKLKP